MVDAIEVLVIAFVLDDVAVTFDLGSFTKGLVGSSSFFGEKENRRIHTLVHHTCTAVYGTQWAFHFSAVTRQTMVRLTNVGPERMPLIRGTQIQWVTA